MSSHQINEKFLNLSPHEQQILRSAASDPSASNALTLVKLYLGESPGPAVTAFLQQLKKGA